MPDPDIKDFKENIVEKCIDKLDYAGDIGKKREAIIQLLIATAVTESQGLKYTVQRAHEDGRQGNALGLFQVERPTAQDIIARYLHRTDRKEIIKVKNTLYSLSKTLNPSRSFEKYSLEEFSTENSYHPIKPNMANFQAHQLYLESTANPVLSCAIARVKYATITEPLPEKDDLRGQAIYYSKYYNAGGGGTPGKFIKDMYDYEYTRSMYSDKAWSDVRKTWNPENGNLHPHPPKSKPSPP